MPWEITIKHPDDLPLGTPEAVAQHLVQVFAGTEVYREPSGREKLAALPPGMTMPDFLSKHLEEMPPTVQADFSGDAYSLRFYLGEEGAAALSSVDIEARGATRPAMPLMEKLTLATGWIVVDAWGNTLVQRGRTLDP